MRAPSRTQKKRRQDALGAGLIVVSLLVSVGLAAVYWTTAAQSSVNASTMCPDSGPAELTALLIDATDPITPIQRASLHNYFEKLVQSVPVHAAIEVFTVDQIGDKVLHPIGEPICNPGRGGTFWTQNPALIESRWRERFWQPLQVWEQQAVDREASRQSPILESLQSIAVTEFQRPALSAKPRRLVLVSDMLHHTLGLSHYRSVAPFDEFSRSNYYQTVRTQWSGVAVQIVYVTRPGTPQGPSHLEFWRQYFSAGGGILADVTTF